MFRPVRRDDRRMTEEECRSILAEATSGVLALSGDDGYPYAVPMSYVLKGDTLYFHSAPEGHKIDAVKRCERASFCVADRDRVDPEHYTTHYRSVIAFGRIRLVEDEAEMRCALHLLADKYSPQMGEGSHRSVIDAEIHSVAVLAMQLEHITGKKHPALEKE